MPAAPLKPDNAQGLSQQDVWDLVHFVLALPYDETSLKSLARPTAMINHETKLISLDSDREESTHHE